MADTVLDSADVPIDIPRAVIATGVGAVTFPVLLGLNQIGLKSLRVSSGSPVLLASTAGGLSVTVASLIASTAVLKTYTFSKNLTVENGHGNSATRQVNFTLGNLLVSTVSGAVVFRALGGRFSSVVPSHLHFPGAFARHCIPASPSYANGSQKEFIRTVGTKYGCHSCGRRGTKQFYADHQPPNKIIKMKSEGSLSKDGGQLSQYFYPQCPKCSEHQGQSLLGAEIPTSPIIAHPFTLRTYHIFLPTSLLLLLLKSNLLGDQQMNGARKTTSVIENSDEKTVNEQQVAKQVPPTQMQNAQRISSKQNLMSDLVSNFPLLIIWRKLVAFIDSFSPIGSFHLTLWSFSIIAALGTL